MLNAAAPGSYFYATCAKLNPTVEVVVDVPPGFCLSVMDPGLIRATDTLSPAFNGITVVIKALLSPPPSVEKVLYWLVVPAPVPLTCTAKELESLALCST